jgi:quercetin dioxygenase-like cupin family protein
MTAAAARFCWDEIALDRVTEMVSRKEISAGGARLSQTYLKKGAVSPWHRHDEPQWVYVLQGSISVMLEKGTQTVREGEVIRIEAGAAHQVEAMDDAFVFDAVGA